MAISYMQYPYNYWAPHRNFSVFDWSLTWLNFKNSSKIKEIFCSECHYCQLLCIINLVKPEV